MKVRVISYLREPYSFKTDKGESITVSPNSEKNTEENTFDKDKINNIKKGGKNNPSSNLFNFFLKEKKFEILYKEKPEKKEVESKTLNKKK